MHYNVWNERYTDCKIQKYSYLKQFMEIYYI